MKSFFNISSVPVIAVLVMMVSCGPMSEYDKVEKTEAERYAIVYKDSCCAVYDLEREVQVTELQYDTLRLRNRADSEVGPICVFVFKTDGQTGLLSVAEENNETMSITFP